MYTLNTWSHFSFFLWSAVQFCTRRGICLLACNVYTQTCVCLCAHALFYIISSKHVTMSYNIPTLFCPSNYLLNIFLSVTTSSIISSLVSLTVTTLQLPLQYLSWKPAFKDLSYLLDVICIYAAWQNVFLIIGFILKQYEKLVKTQYTSYKNNTKIITVPHNEHTPLLGLLFYITFILWLGSPFLTFCKEFSYDK